MKFKSVSILPVVFCLAIAPVVNNLSSCSQNITDLSALGDSLTFDSKYDLYVAQILNYKHVKNYGIPTSTISDVPNRLPFIYRYKEIAKDSRIIAIDGGVNDSSASVPIGKADDNTGKTFLGSLNILLSGIKQEFPSAYIFFITPFYYNDDRLAKLTPYIEAIRSSCNKYQIDCMDIFNPQFDFKIERDTVDGLHPSLEFTQRVWAPAIAQFITTHKK